MISGISKRIGLLAAAGLLCASSTFASTIDVSSHLNGEIYMLDEFMGNGTFFSTPTLHPYNGTPASVNFNTDAGPGAASLIDPIIDKYDFTPANQVQFTIWDWLTPTDSFRVYDNGVLQTPTSVRPGMGWQFIDELAPIGTPDCPNTPISAADGCHWTDNPIVAFNDAAFYKATYLFAAGVSHDLAIQIIQKPACIGWIGCVFENNNADFNEAAAIGTMPDGTAVFSLQAIQAPTATPEPTTLVLLGAGLLGVASRRRKKNQ